MITQMFRNFTKSERSGGLILIFCTVLSLVLANSPAGESYASFWHAELATQSVEFWINDGLMTIFFLLVGLEIEREIYIGELSDLRKALLPVIAAVGGMLVPAGIHLLFNYGSGTQSGFGIPMATDIAFSLAILSLVGHRIPPALRIFLTALAIIDDLGAIIVIAIFYSDGIAWMYLGGALMLLSGLFVLNLLKVYRLWIYLLTGIAVWYCMFRSGIHPTITGVLLAFVIPFAKGEEDSISYKLQHILHKPVAFLILPLFALANTAISFEGITLEQLFNPNTAGIAAGLIIGKPLGIFLFSIVGAATGICLIPEGVRKLHLLFTGALAGIGFTMSIFISLLAFEDPATVTGSKIAILAASALSALIGWIGLKLALKRAC
jgi:NhaA family Na+:H+ antiporter